MSKEGWKPKIPPSPRLHDLLRKALPFPKIHFKIISYLHIFLLASFIYAFPTKFCKSFLFHPWRLHVRVTHLRPALCWDAILIAGYWRFENYRSYLQGPKSVRMRDCRLPPRLNWILPFSGLLRGKKWFETDVSGPHTGPIFMGQAAQEDS